MNILNKKLLWCCFCNKVAVAVCLDRNDNEHVALACVWGLEANLGQKLRPWPSDQTFVVNHLRFALQAMFGCLATSQTLLDNQNSLSNVSRKRQNILWFSQANNVWRAMFCDVAKVKHCVWHANSNVLQTMPDRLSRTSGIPNPTIYDICVYLFRLITWVAVIAIEFI